MVRRGRRDPHAFARSPRSPESRASHVASCFSLSRGVCRRGDGSYCASRPSSRHGWPPLRYLGQALSACSRTLSTPRRLLPAVDHRPRDGDTCPALRAACPAPPRSGASSQRDPCGDRSLARTPFTFRWSVRIVNWLLLTSSRGTPYRMTRASGPPCPDRDRQLSQRAHQPGHAFQDLGALAHPHESRRLAALKHAFALP